MPELIGTWKDEPPICPVHKKYMEDIAGDYYYCNDCQITKDEIYAMSEKRSKELACLNIGKEPDSLPF